MKFATQALLVIAISPSFAGSYEDFFTAVQRDDDTTVNALLRRGFDPNSHDPQGQTGLTLATRDRNWRVVKVLLDSAASDVNELNGNGESPLMLAALRGEKDWCLRLLERGARVQISGWAPIHYAATGPNPAVVALLLERGAEPEATSPNGSTPLMLAARYGSEATVDLLLARGADVGRRNERGLNAVDFARLGGRESLAARLAPR
jgi:ankyrin repeat protein